MSKTQDPHHPTILKQCITPPQDRSVNARRSRTCVAYRKRSILPCNKFLKQKVDDLISTKMAADVFESSKCLNYMIYKTSLCYENYLIFLSCKWRKLFAKYRYRNFQLPIETGIFHNIQREDRIYKLCNSNQISDEFHFILQCKSLSEDKDSWISIITQICPLKNFLSCLTPV